MNVNPWKGIERRFASWVACEREKRGMTPTALARHLTAAGVPLQCVQVQRLERGERGVRLGEALRIIEALGGQIPDVLGLPTEDTPTT